MEEAIPAADWYYQTPPLPTQPFVNSGKAAPHLQWTTLVGNRHATHPIGATIAQSAERCCWDDAGSAAVALQSKAQ